jgi:hypothetical protein
VFEKMIKLANNNRIQGLEAIYISIPIPELLKNLTINKLSQA